MQETRTALTEKLDRLEHQVVNTVQSITTPVVETVETVKKAVEDTIGAVRNTVQSTVSSVTCAAEKTAETVKETFNLSGHIQRHPWLTMAGAALVGYIGGRLLMPANTGSRGQPTTSGSPFPESMHRAAERPEPRGHNGRHEEEARDESESLLGELTSYFGSEVNQLKGLAIGALVGVVRDLVTQNLSGEMGSRLKDWLNGVTEKMGGKPFNEPLVKPRSESSEERVASHSHRDGGGRARL